MFKSSFPQNLIRLLFPEKCLACSEITLEDAPFCRECMLKFGILLKEDCPVCKNGRKECVCRGSKNSRFLFYYSSDLSKQIMATLKHRITPLKAEYIAKLLSGLVPEKVRYDGIVFPPRSPKNRKRYGFDQSEIISKSLAKQLGIPCLKVLKRRKRVKRGEQKLLSAGQRIKNVKNAFAADMKKLAGVQNVILFDDIMTTGATVSECTRVLKRAGVKKVTVISVAKTPKSLKAVFTK